MTDSQLSLTPRLVVTNADDAIQFYVEVFAAREIERFTDSDGRVVHAALAIDDSIFALKDEDDADPIVASPAPEGTSVLLNLTVDNPDGVVETAVEHGAEVLIPVDDRFYGRREGRIRDPFGHLWIVGTPIEDPDDTEIQRRLDETTS